MAKSHDVHNDCHGSLDTGHSIWYTPQHRGIHHMEIKTRAPEPLARRGHHGDMVGVVTRVRLRRCRDLVVAWKQYREIERVARRIPGFRHSAFLLQGPRTFAMVSLWDSQLAIDQFETAAASLHPIAVRWTRLRAREMWSASTSSVNVSPSADTWRS